jgi:epoxyqueuosine reductase
MDASRCIAYLTIERREAIAPELMEKVGRQVFGCDICQDVCPWNRKALVGADPELQPRPELVNPALDWLAAMDESDFEREFNGSPVRRAGFAGLKRNTAIAMGNSGLGHFAPLVEQWADAADEGLRSAARWALGKLKLEHRSKLGRHSSQTL